MSTKLVSVVESIEARLGKLTLGKMIQCIRLCDEISLPDFAKKLGLSKSHLCDIEKDRKSISPERAARFAKILGYSQEQFVQLSLQSLVDRGRLKLNVLVEAA